MSANKLLGKTVTEIEYFGYIGRIKSTNMAVDGNSSYVAESEFAYGTPVPPYRDRYAQLMLDSWEGEDTFSECYERCRKCRNRSLKTAF